MKKNIAIVGYGYVGQAMYRFFKDHYNIKVYDPFSSAIQSSTKEEVNSCDFAVVCVPTPMSDGGEVDLSIIRETLGWLNTPNILIKSTIPPGTTEMLAKETGKNICFSPEYIGEGNYVVQWWKDKGYPHPTDMKYHDFQIFGGPREVTSAVLQYFKRVLGPDVRYHQTDSKTAELCKYMENSWAGMKVTFCNEFYELAKSVGVDYDELRELWLLDGRVERMHTAVFKDKRGFGGKCLPKDINGIVKVAEAHGYEPKFMKQMLESNKDFNSMN